MKRRSKRAVDEEAVVRIVNEVRVDLPFLGGRKTLFLARTRLREAGVRIGRDRFFDVLRRNGMLVERRTLRPHMNMHSCRIFWMLRARQGNRLSSSFATESTIRTIWALSSVLRAPPAHMAL